MNLGLLDEEWVSFQDTVDKYRSALASCQNHRFAAGPGT